MEVVMKMLDLAPVISGIEEEIDFSQEYEIREDLWKKSDILDLEAVHVQGKIEKRSDGDCYLSFVAKGKMKIHDSITFEEVWYPFSIEMDENLNEIIEKEQKSLDIIEFLWQNIVLEVPLRYTTVQNYEPYQGDGWKLVSEEELNTNNPFSTLLNNKDGSD